MFRGKVQVAPLEMVDNVISGSKCGSTTVTINASINLFMERKKLNLNAHKCFRIHIGRNLGDFITKDANSNTTLVARNIHAYAILAKIRALLSEIPLGSRRMENGLVLREAWFVNGILFNSEV